MLPTMIHRLNRCAGLLALSMVLALPQAAHAQSAKLEAVTTFTVLNDIVQQVGGDRVHATPLIGTDRDAHHFEPTPMDVQKIQHANVVFLHGGAGFESFLPKLIAASGFGGPVVPVSEGVVLRKRLRDAGAGQTSDDPHTWNAPLNAVIYVDHIVATLERLDPAGKAGYEQRGRDYVAQLKALDNRARSLFASLPADRRKAITSHNAFGYLGAAYGITFYSPLGIQTDSQPSAQTIGKLIDQIRAEHIGVYFIENANDARFVKQIADATGARPGGELFAEALSAPGGPAPTYLALLNHNIDTLYKALARP